MQKCSRDEETRRLVSGFIDVYLRLTEREMEEYKIHRSKLDPEVREDIMEIETSWKIEGREEGLQLGLQQGC